MRRRARYLASHRASHEDIEEIGGAWLQRSAEASSAEEAAQQSCFNVNMFVCSEEDETEAQASHIIGRAVLQWFRNKQWLQQSPQSSNDMSDQLFAEEDQPECVSGEAEGLQYEDEMQTAEPMERLGLA